MEVNRSHYSGTPDGYMCNGVYSNTKPKGKVYEGYINTGSEIIFVYHDRPWAFIATSIVACVLLVIVLLTHGRLVNIEYRVSFAQNPVYADGIFYCSVVNVADIPVEVYFTDGDNKSITRYLNPGETIPYIELDFQPDCIVYGGKYEFELGVQHD